MTAPQGLMASLDLTSPVGVARRHARFATAFGMFGGPSTPSATFAHLKAEMARPAHIRFLMTHGSRKYVGEITDGLDTGEYTAIAELHEGTIPCDILVVFACFQEPEAWLPLVEPGSGVVTYSDLLYNRSISPLVSEFGKEPFVTPREVGMILDKTAARRAAESPSGDYFYRDKWRTAIKERPGTA
ncbi:hypothetical protein GCM10025867_50600 (plasmid) [Frondihabitans sucicola]|uniref:Uncharacterized protein n=1 Tax=Frondihabitans sucicola TaxID=1268041 RepID=A0ABM8GWH7_9MICO|nr:hypothetical protein [Frondihabitans sucicola]BDZ52819.1 hypothetical protein GCM10025867_50600 [Frondihabitans sucicola]